MSAPEQPQVREPERFTGHKVKLPLFEGPLDLLLYLVRANRYDILDIPIQPITSQFMEFLLLMDELEQDIELPDAGDFLVTASSLMAIKSRMLLPKQQSQNEDAVEEESLDPREELVSRLLEYQKFQEAARVLTDKREERSQTFARSSSRDEKPDEDSPDDLQMALLMADVSPFELLRTLRQVLERVASRPIATISRREPFSLAERLRQMVGRMRSGQHTFGELCDDCESRLEVVITFLALLELIRRSRVSVQQLSLFDEIEIALL